MTWNQHTYCMLPKISKKALERSETARIRYRLRMACQYEAEQLVFVDESACDRRTFLRKKAWALEGRQACRKTVFAHGKRYDILVYGCESDWRASARYSVLPAVSTTGMLDCTIVEGSFNTTLFTAFIRDLLDHMQPWPAPNSVVVMDNCVIHKSPEIRELIESRSVRSSPSCCGTVLLLIWPGIGV